MKSFLLLGFSMLVSVTLFSQLILSETHNNVTCYGLCDGSAQVNVTGGTPPYMYQWNNGITTHVVTGTCAGIYNVTVTDAAMSTATISVIIAEPAFIATATSQTNISCFGLCDGTATIVASGGVLPYTYNWSNGQTTSTATNLCAGLYTVTVVDANGCTATTNLTITESPQITIDITGQICQGSTGIVGAYVTGGTPGYSYLWDNTATTQSISNASPGNWCVTITDGNGCTNSYCENIYESPAINLTISSTPETCLGVCDGTTTINATGGIPPLLYSWSNGMQGVTTIAPLCSGNVHVTVTGNDGCSDIISTTIVAMPFAQITGTLTTSSGNIASGDATVTLYNSQWDYLTSVTYNGSFHFDSLCPGDYYLFSDLINSAPYPLTLNSYYDNTAAWTTANPVHLNSGDSINLTFTMAETFVFAPGPGQISGVIVFNSYPGSKANGEPVEGAEVYLEQGISSTLVANTQTNVAGEYFFENIPTGDEYRINVQIPGIPVVITWDNLSITSNDPVFYNLNFIVDTVINGIYTDSTLTGISQNRSGLFRIYPNPFNGHLSLVFSDKPSKRLVQIYDIFGNCCFEKNCNASTTMKILTNELKSGVYLLKVTTGNTIYIKKVVKE